MFSDSYCKYSLLSISVMLLTSVLMRLLKTETVVVIAVEERVLLVPVLEK